MTAITARIPIIDWSKGFKRHWNDDKPAVTHAFNALSFLFPQGEKFFIDVAREVEKKYNISSNPQLEAEVKAFITQESIHSRQHDHYNAILNKQGFENVIHDLLEQIQNQVHHYCSSLTKLAMVCAYEHYTAVLGNYILSNPQVLKPAQPNMALIWGWHSAEETEHKAVCFDLYQAVGGGWLRRVSTFVLVTLNFSLMFVRLYLSLLHRDGCLRPSHLLATLSDLVKFFFGRAGVGWYLIKDGLAYLLPYFHPWKNNNRKLLKSWLIANQSKLRETGK